MPVYSIYTIQCHWNKGLIDSFDAWFDCFGSTALALFSLLKDTETSIPLLILKWLVLPGLIVLLNGEFCSQWVIAYKVSLYYAILSPSEVFNFGSAECVLWCSLNIILDLH